MRKNEEDQSAKLIRYMVGVLLGGVVALAACFVLLLLASVGISSGRLAQEHMDQITIVACVVGSFLGAMTAIKRCGARTLIVGLAVGAVLFLLLLTGGVLLYHTTALEAGGIGILCGSLCGGAAAGVLLGMVGKKGAHRSGGRKKIEKHR